MLEQKFIRKYLDTYSEVRARRMAAMLASHRWSCAVVVPVYAECDLLRGFVDSLKDSAAACHRSGESRPLLIVVVNAKQGDDAAKFADNEQTLTWLREGERKIAGAGFDLIIRDTMDVLAIDANSQEFRFPSDQGVGLARKLGCDVAFALWTQERIESPWIRNTDADVRVAKDYLQEHAGDSQVAAMLEQYAHAPIDATESSWEALCRYEIFLRYYVMGLNYARSPYAFHTIGSTITVNAAYYAMARGFPKRLAGEDFYILNKLAKLGSIAVSRKSPITILDRPSDRVPFGTGAAVKKMLERLPSSEYQIYDPRCFAALKELIEIVHEPSSFPNTENIVSKFAEQSHLQQETIAVLTNELKWIEGLKSSATQTKSHPDFCRRFHEWFDALKTLRFIHIVRDQEFASLEIGRALQISPFLPAETIPSGGGWESILSKLRA